jgi:signal transduction histidine kinase/ligand-binding sensor domain-containing protein
MKNARVFFVFVCILFFGPQTSTITAQTSELKFKHITTTDGLSQNTVSCILQDSKGFMWLGTQDGLNKYDGYSFTQYHYDPYDSTSILGINIYCIVEDKKGHIWVGTESGLNMFDPSRNIFTRYLHKEDDPTSLGGISFRALFIDQADNLWVGSTGSDLDLFDPHSKTFTHFHDTGNTTDRVSYNIRSIYEDAGNNLWIGTLSGHVSCFDREKETFNPYYYQNGKFTDHEIWGITADSNNNIWLSTYRSGLYVIRNSGTAKSKTEHFMHDPDDPFSLSSNDVLAVFEDSNGRLWVGTENGGLNEFDRNSGKFYRIPVDPYNEYSLNHSSIWAIFEDKTGNLWFGSYAGGINLLEKYRKDFGHFKHIPGKDNSLSNDLARAFCEDSEGHIWIGTDGGGLNMFDRETGNFIIYNKDNSNLGSDAVLSVFEDRKGQLWVGTWEGGMNLFDRQSGTFKQYTRENSKLSSNNIFSIIEDSKGQIWAATYFGGLSCFNSEEQSFRNFTPENSQISDDMMMMLIEDAYGMIWVCANSGLNLFDPDSETFTVYTHDSKDQSTLSKGFVICILEAADSTLWVGTTSGLNRFDRQTGAFESYYITDGLPSNSIKGIEQDDQGYLWISSNGGLSRFDPETGEFMNYNQSDGLQDAEYLQGSSYKASTGELYFGGVHGFNAFHPDNLINNPLVPSVVLTDFQIFNKPASIGDHGPLQSHISETEQITLSHRQTVFSFEFTALNYISSEKNQYAYMMEGFDADWIFAGTNHRASYTNLDPGEYTFRVKASNNDGVWNEEGSSVEVIITPPYWQRLGFKLIAISLGILLILLIYYIRVRQIIRGNKLLNEQVIERTKEIKEQNNKLEEQTEILKAQRDELDATISVRDKLFSIISHDLRSPFTTLKGFIELISLKYDSYTDKEIRDFIRIISESADNVYNLLDNLLNWSRSQRGKVKLDAQMTDMVQLIRKKIELLNHQAVTKNIQIETICATQELLIKVDPDLINVVIQNLLTNAIKFTREDGRIEVKCFIEDSHAQIYVQDNGIGMSEEDAGKLFRSDTHFSSIGTANEKGIGLGMLICKDFVEIHGGKIWVESELDKGSTFFVKLPL